MPALFTSQGQSGGQQAGTHAPSGVSQGVSKLGPMLHQGSVRGSASWDPCSIRGQSAGQRAGTHAPSGVSQGVSKLGPMLHQGSVSGSASWDPCSIRGQSGGQQAGTHAPSGVSQRVSELGPMLHQGSVRGQRAGTHAPSGVSQGSASWDPCSIRGAMGVSHVATCQILEELTNERTGVQTSDQLDSMCLWTTGCTRKTRIIDVVYNASNNELVRTKTLVKNCIVLIDGSKAGGRGVSHVATCRFLEELTNERTGVQTADQLDSGRISRDNWHKRRKTGGKRKPYHKKRKYELGRPPANTKIGPRRIHTVRVRGGNKKYRALRLDVGNFAWGSECCTRKTRIIDVVYNASNNELVRTKTLVKNCIVLIDGSKA
ncbi:hypothetical protein NHX12_004773, partial [Muraenolepis orangiensis]